MNHYKFLAVTLVALTLSSASGAKESVAINEVAALRSAYLMSSIKSTEDFAKYAGTKKLAASVADVFRTKNSGRFQAPLVTMLDSTTVQFAFSSRTIQVGYARFSEGILTVAGQPVKLQPFKTLINYKSEIATILKNKSAGFVHMLIPEADAANLVSKGFDWISFYLGYNAAAFIDETIMAEPRDGNLEAELARAYANRIRVSRTDKEAPKRSNKLSVFPVLFQCKGAVLAKMAQTSLTTDGRNIERDPIEIFGLGLEKTASGYKYSTDLGVVDMDSNFKVRQSTDSGIRVGSSFLSGPPWFRLPLIASRCCAKAGCYEKVRQSFETELKSQGRAYQRGNGAR